MVTARPYALTFDETHVYSHSDPRADIMVPVTISTSGATVHLTASIDTGAWLGSDGEELPTTLFDDFRDDLFHTTFGQGCNR